MSNQVGDDVHSASVVDSLPWVGARATDAVCLPVIDLRGPTAFVDLADGPVRPNLALVTPVCTPLPSVATVPTVQDRLVIGLFRRAVDVVGSLVLLCVLAPLALVVAAVVALDSKGPVLFRQDRVGRGGLPFRFVKFRTMHVDARQRFPELYDYQFDRRELSTMYFKLADDPRLTRFGRWLRRTSLDEIPNLLNVLKGDMTFVGPRPELVEMLPNYLPHQLLKFSVKPGLTGLAQTSGRNILRFQETVAADLYYVQNRSLRFDFRILVRTVRQVSRQVGAL